MQVTKNMISNTVTFNAHRAISRLFELKTQLSSWRPINKPLSNVEDADLTKLLTDLATFENNYQAALMAGARIVQPTLLDSMR